jgi:hypothetical protein
LRWEITPCSATRNLDKFLLVKYIDGNVKKEENGVFLQN